MQQKKPSKLKPTFIRIDPALWLKFKLRAMEKGKTAQLALAELLKEWVSR